MNSIYSKMAKAAVCHRNPCDHCSVTCFADINQPLHNTTISVQQTLLPVFVHQILTLLMKQLKQLQQKRKTTYFNQICYSYVTEWNSATVWRYERYE